MSFAVNSLAVQQYAWLWSSEHEHATKAQEYADKNLELEPSAQGLINIVEPVHGPAKEQVQDAMKGLVALADACAQGLQQAADMYTKTDAAAAARLDATYPAAQGRPQMPNLPTMPQGQSGAQSIMEHFIPEGRLNPPKAPDGYTDPLQLFNSISDCLSPSAIIEKILKELIGVNPAEKLSELITGKWDDYAKCGDAFNNLSWFCSDVAEDVNLNLSGLMDQWSGNAADEAYQYFSNLVSKLQGYRDALGHLRDNYVNAAKGVSSFTEGVVDIINDIFDDAFWAALEAAAGGFLSETGVGPAISWSIAGFQCADIAHQWSKATGMISDVQNVMRVAVGDTQRLLAGGQFKTAPLPETGYRNPGVK